MIIIIMIIIIIYIYIDMLCMDVYGTHIFLNLLQCMTCFDAIFLAICRSQAVGNFSRATGGRSSMPPTL